MRLDRNTALARPRILTGTAACALALATAACGGSAAPTAQGAAAPSASQHPKAAPSESMTRSTSARFGSDCGMVPSAGMGSFHGMSMDPVVTAASHNPLLTTFAADAKKAGLAAELNSARGITVFAPENSAFARLHGAAMSMLENKKELAQILKYHVVAGRKTPADLAAGRDLATMQGSALMPAKMGAVYEANKAHVICGNIQTANATVYIIDTVLMPTHMH